MLGGGNSCGLLGVIVAGRGHKTTTSPQSIPEVRQQLSLNITVLGRERGKSPKLDLEQCWPKTSEAWPGKTAGSVHSLSQSTS